MLKVNAFNIQKTLIFHIGVEGENNMKKLAIAGASVALAALPVVGVFAVTGPQSFTDRLSVTINEACTLENGDNAAGSYVDRVFSAVVPAGTASELTQTSPTVTAETGITVTCNTASSAWHVTASAVDLADNDSHTFSRGTATSGATSYWAFKLGTGTYTDWSALPEMSGTTEPTVLSSSMSGVSTSFNPQYKVYVAPAQASGSYSGSVTYTLVLGA